MRTKISRRALLSELGLCTVTVCLMSSGCSSHADTDAQPKSGAPASPGSDKNQVATKSEITTQNAKKLEWESTPVLLSVNSSGEYTAVIAACTHQGCALQLSDSELHCPCHNSRFTVNGELLQGPATRSLEKLTVTVTDEKIFLSR